MSDKIHTASTSPCIIILHIQNIGTYLLRSFVPCRKEVDVSPPASWPRKVVIIGYREREQ